VVKTNEFMQEMQEIEAFKRKNKSFPSFLKEGLY